jgi:hypothetical protein
MELNGKIKNKLEQSRAEQSRAAASKTEREREAVWSIWEMRDRIDYYIREEAAGTVKCRCVTE